MDEIPKEIQKVLDTYFDYIESKIPNLLESYYLYGSTSIGSFKYGISDIDFIAVLIRKVTEQELGILKEIHLEMQKKFPEVRLDGMYVIKDDTLILSENESLRFNEGKFYGYRKFDENSIDAYQLKKYGITIRGERIESLNYEVNWEILINNMRNNLNTYWVNWVNECKRFPSVKYIGLFISQGMVEWGVLGVSRLFYTFIEKDITSKAGAGEYVLKSVPQRWHKIINESLRLRNGNKKSLYKSFFKRRKDSLDYIEFMIQKCNNLFQ